MKIDIKIVCLFCLRFGSDLDASWARFWVWGSKLSPKLEPKPIMQNLEKYRRRKNNGFVNVVGGPGISKKGAKSMSKLRFTQPGCPDSKGPVDFPLKFF